QPLQRRRTRAHILREEASGLLREMDEDRAGLEDRERAARDVVVDDRRDLLVGIERGEGRSHLLLLPEIDRDHPVLEAGLLEHDGDLPAVGRGPRVEIDHVPSCAAAFWRISRTWTAEASEPDRSQVADTSPPGQPAPVPPRPQYPPGFFARYCWWYPSA